MIRVFEAGRGRQPCHRLLREVLNPATDITRPLILRSIVPIIDGNKGELVELAGDSSATIAVPRGQAGTHGDAENVRRVEFQRSRKGCDLAIVDDLERHILHFAPDLLEDQPDLAIEILL